MDWPGLMRAGMGPRAAGGLGLRPEVFWRLSPMELRIMLGAEAGAAPLTRARLDELAAAYPDKNEERGDGGY